MIRCREPRTTGRGCESAQGSVSGERFGHPVEGSSEAGVEQSFCREPNDLARAHLVESADTGAREHEATFLADVFGLVEPDDVRWIVISHDDVDHTGNLNALAAAAPNATIVIDWFMAERMGASLEVSPLRWRWMVDGERLDVGDRELVLVRPRIFDSPTSRGVFDPTTGVYWAADAFATPMPTPVSDVAEIDRTVWTEGMATFNQYISPWLMLADEARFQQTVDRIAALDPVAIAGCHTPVVRERHVADAISITRGTRGVSVPPQPDQAVLDQIQLTLGAIAA